MKILVLMLIYFGYFLVRNSLEDPTQKARVGAVFNLFAAALIIPLYYIIPRVLGGLHPGSGDEGSLATLTNLNSTYRMVFYPAVFGFIFIGSWIVEVRNRIDIVKQKLLENNLR